MEKVTTVCQTDNLPGGSSAQLGQFCSARRPRCWGPGYERLSPEGPQLGRYPAQRYHGTTQWWHPSERKLWQGQGQSSRQLARRWPGNSSSFYWVVSVRACMYMLMCVYKCVCVCVCVCVYNDALPIGQLQTNTRWTLLSAFYIYLTLLQLSFVLLTFCCTRFKANFNTKTQTK